ncbi:MAG: SGNH/GDSL hydrolase family protein [Bacteroidia bacterium]|nr:SGNH/GDSL hydrolase family protein [Bacteroidia bacterium]
MKEKKKYWYRRHPRLAGAIFFIFLLIIGLSLIEIALRLAGNKPGFRSIPTNMQLVEELEFKFDYQNDSLGIFHISPEARDKICYFLHNDSLEPMRLEDLQLDYSLDKAAAEFDRLGTNELEDEEFVAFYQSFLSKSPDSLTQTDSAYLQYFACPINADGFRSIPFARHQTSKKRILLLGDSFTWGIAGDPITNSFADRLSARGYMIYNTGIVGADPAQYLAIMQKYLPRIQPDLVIINFFMGNDQMDWIRIPSPEHPMNYISNAGWLGGYIEGCYVTAQESYDVNLQGFCIPASGPDLWGRFCRNTVLGTRIWFATTPNYSTTISHPSRCDPKYDPPISEYYILEMQKIGQQNGIPVLLSLIPYHRQLPGYPGEIENFEESAPKNFPHVTYHVPPNLTPEDYRPDDDHFNNSGMKKYADHLQQLIDSTLSQPR